MPDDATARGRNNRLSWGCIGRTTGLPQRTVHSVLKEAVNSWIGHIDPSIVQGQPKEKDEGGAVGR